MPPPLFLLSPSCHKRWRGGQGTHPRLGQGGKKRWLPLQQQQLEARHPPFYGPDHLGLDDGPRVSFWVWAEVDPPVFFYSDLGPSCSHARSSNIGSRAAKTKLTRFDDEGGSCFSIPPPLTIKLDFHYRVHLSGWRRRRCRVTVSPAGQKGKQIIVTKEGRAPAIASSGQTEVIQRSWPSS